MRLVIPGLLDRRMTGALRVETDYLSCSQSATVPSWNAILILIPTLTMCSDHAVRCAIEYGDRLECQWRHHGPYDYASEKQVAHMHFDQRDIAAPKQLSVARSAHM